MSNTVNFILFQMLWLSSVLGAANGILWPACVILSLMVVVFLKSKYAHSANLKYVVFSVFFGFVIDSILASSGLIEYNYNLGIAYLAPIWILFLWIGFALTFNHSMAWMFKNKMMANVFIGLGAPLSYFSAAKLSAIEINNLSLTLVLISVLWLGFFNFIDVLQASTKQKEAYHHV